MPEHDLCRDAGENGCEPLAAVAVTGQWLCSFAVVGWWGGCGRGFAPASVRSPAVTLLARKGRQAGCQPDEERYASRR